MLKGTKHTPETREKMRKISLALGLVPPRQKGKTFPNRKRLEPGLKRSPRSEETKAKLVKALRGIPIGAKAWNWKGGITPLNIKIRGSGEHRQWSRDVFKRDNYTCVWCGDDRGGNLNADHIKLFSEYPKLRFEIDNGRTLCVSCHKTRHKKLRELAYAR